MSEINTTSASLSTAVPDEKIRRFQIWWTLCLTITALMTVMNIWVAAAFIRFAKTSSILRKTSASDTDGGLIFKTAIAALVLPIFRYITSLATSVVGLDPTANNACNVTILVNNVFFVAPILAVYFFLWVRQRAFYEHPAIGGLFSKYVSGLSKVSIALIVLPTVASLVVEMTINQYKSDTLGCMYSNRQTDINFRFFIYGGVLTCGQATLLCLFIYPLYVHSKHLSGKGEAKQEESIASAVTTTIREETVDPNYENSERFKPSMDHRETRGADEEQRIDKLPGTSKAKSKDPRETMIYRAIKRTLILACLSILSDLTSMIVSGLLVPADTPYYVINILLDFDTTVNILTVAGSFKLWKTIIFGINPGRGN